MSDFIKRPYKKSANPTTSFDSLPAIIRASFDHEIVVTKQIKVMASEALKQGDHMLYELCLRYLKEQVEEHDKTQTWVDKLASFGEDKIALRMLDEEMGEIAG
jgi:ferritin